MMWVVALVGGFLATIAGSEVTGAARFLSRRVVLFAASRVPPARQEQLREEWLGEWEAWDQANLARLLWSIGLIIAARRSASAWEERESSGRRLRGWRVIRDGERRVFVHLGSI